MGSYYLKMVVIFLLVIFYYFGKWSKYFLGLLDECFWLVDFLILVVNLFYYFRFFKFMIFSFVVIELFYLSLKEKS